MVVLVFLLRVLLSPASPSVATLAAGAHRTAPSYLTDSTALDHARAAVIAAATYDVDPALLLSIGWHESRYLPATVTPELGHKTSCGVMTPEPLARCTVTTVLAGYLAGAAHLRGWYDACHGDETCALTGYAGGWHLIRLCQTQDLAACHTPAVFLQRARAIAGPGDAT